MATQFVRVDLSETARDYRPIAVEPGVPMLDRSGANSRILFRWLGGMVAEPVWQDDLVGYYVRDDKGGRLEEVICQPVSAQDLQGKLRDDLAKLRQRLDQSRGETPTERTLRKVLMRSFQDLVDNPARTDLDSYFFQYRDVLGNPRLIWCWGYERLDQEPAPSVVCTTTDCNLLYVRRPGKSPRCPSCEGLLQARPKRKTNRKLALLALLALLLLLGGLIYALFFWPPSLVATPNKVAGPVGTRIDCTLWEKSLFSKKNVTHDTIGITWDPRVAKFNQATNSIRLTGVGTTKIEFQHDGRKAEVVVKAEPSFNPDKLKIEPDAVDLAVGTTARLKVFGEYNDGRPRVDLTDSVEWVVPKDDKVFFARGNLVEGLTKGSSAIEARYCGDPESKAKDFKDRVYVKGDRTINVADANFQSIEVAVEPAKIGIKLSGKVRVEAVNGDGRHYNVLGSSQLKTEVSPNDVATLQDETLRGEHKGSGKLAATFGSGGGNPLAGSGDFAVVLPRPYRSAVHPTSLDLAVGEIADIAYVSPDPSPVYLSSPNKGIVDFTADNRLVGRAEGDTDVTVNQSGKSLGTVKVSVRKREFQGIFFDPGSLTVEVDGTLRPKVFAMLAGSDTDPARDAEIAPEWIVAEKMPLPKFADFDEKLFELAGVSPTNPSSPQELAVRMGNLKTVAPVEVVLAPCRLELEPAGPVALPLGQMMRLQAFANYGGGRRVQVLSERLKWFSQEKSVPGLVFYDNRESREVVGAVGALQPGKGPLHVFATYHSREPDYHGVESNHVSFNSVDRDPTVKLEIDVDRTLRIAGEGGFAVLTASGSGGDVELVPSRTSFQSSDPKVLKMIPGKTGYFATMIPGSLVVTGSHSAAKEPATKAFRVCDPAKVKLIFDPASVRVPVNERARLSLFMVEMNADGKTEKQRAELLGQGVGYYVAQPNAVRFYPPWLTGLTPAPEFEVSGSIPVLRAATARVAVLDAQSTVLRIVPSAESPLAPGQSVSLKVEEQVGNTDVWEEVRPDAVEWNVPPQSDFIWKPQTENLRPTVTLRREFKGDLKLDAAVSDNKTASVIFTLKATGPDAADPAAQLVLDREPGGKLLPVGQSQRYAVLVEKDGHREPAADIHWPGNFENEYVKWEAPVLTAKKEGYTQFLRAEVAGRNVLWHTTTYLPGAYSPPPDEPKPDWVKIFRQEGSKHVQDARFPVGATYTDFKVEVHYPDGYTRFVTKKALFHISGPSVTAPLAAEHGKFVGLRPGTTEVTAEFQGLVSDPKFPLNVVVTADVEVDKIVIESPDRPLKPGETFQVPLRPGETYELHVIGYKDGKSVGDITGLGNLTWSSSKADVARMSGNSVIASGLGQTAVAVERKGLKSSAQVSVLNSINAELRVDPKEIEMSLGDSQQLGDIIHVYRGDLDVSQQATAVPESPGVVRFDPATRTLHAVGVGSVPLGITMGDKLARVVVNVRPGPVGDGKLVVEPASLILAPGQADRLNVSLELASGDKVATMAAFKVADPTVAAVDEAIGRVRALKTGKTEIKVFVANQAPVVVPLEVTDEEITALSVEPASLELAAGDHAYLKVSGTAKTSGCKELFPQADLTVVPEKGVVEVIAGEDIQARTIGKDTINITWRNRLKAAVPVNVAANTISDLEIKPAPESTVNPGQAVTYEVSGMRGGNRVILTPADGVQLNVTDPAVAGVVSGTTVEAKSPGQTKVVADLGGKKAETVLNVAQGVAGGPAVGGTGVIAEGGTIYRDDGHGVVIGGTDVIRNGNLLVSEIPPQGKVVGLSFQPAYYQQGVQALPQTAKLLRQYENHGFEDVSNDPGVQVKDPPNPEIATLKKVDGGWQLTPLKAGMTKMTATLGDQSATMPIEFNGDLTGGTIAGTVIVNPSNMEVWVGEKQAIGNVAVDPGGGQPLVEAAKLGPITLEARDHKGCVSVSGNEVTGTQVGDEAVTVSVGGQSVTVNVHVTAGDTLTFNPPEIALERDQAIVPAVMAATSGGTVAVTAQIESMDKTIIDADPSDPTKFVAKSQGQTQLRGTYHGKSVLAQVSVAGKRFETVNPGLNPINDTQFTVNIEVLAATGEGELEYRVYDANSGGPGETWKANEPADGGNRKASLASGVLTYGEPGKVYQLVLEARKKGSNENPEKYPLNLRLDIERKLSMVVNPQAPVNNPTPDKEKK